MIGRLRGIVIERSDEEVLLEVAGVGYSVRCGVRTLAELVDGQEVIVHIESQTREDGTRLYGFATKDERKAFQALLGVQGVGPKAALAVLDILTPHQLAHAVASEDKTAVARASGVGPKLAQRIVIELKGKALSIAAFEPLAAGIPKTGVIAPSVRGDAVAGLMGLGIIEANARQSVDHALNELGGEAALADIIRHALKHVGANR
jgi:Holliday junction DNA helicase RuvA